VVEKSGKEKKRKKETEKKDEKLSSLTCIPKPREARGRDAMDHIDCKDLVNA